MSINKLKVKNKLYKAFVDAGVQECLLKVFHYCFILLASESSIVALFTSRQTVRSVVFVRMEEFRTPKARLKLQMPRVNG